VWFGRWNSKLAERSAAPGLRSRNEKVIAGQLDASGLPSSNGENAKSCSSSGNSASLNRSRAAGYAPAYSICSTAGR
jgi:hypothetical protein